MNNQFVSGNEENLAFRIGITAFKTFLITLAGIGVFLLTPDSHATGAIGSSYFDKNILLESDTFAEDVNAITIGEYQFKDSKEQKRYLNTRRFFQVVKSDMRDRFEKNTISTYKAADMLRELRYISFSLNQYFTNMKAYEKTKNVTYKNLASANLVQAEIGYRNLAVITRSTNK